VPFARTPSTASYAAVADASPVPFWLDDPRRPEPLPPFAGRRDTDLLVVGGGFSGLWTALLAKEADPLRDVVVIEGSRVGWAASGRNGGFCEASITHGLDNGLARWPDEIDTLLRLGQENFDDLEATLERYAIDCSFERVDVLSIAHADFHLDDGLAEYAALATKLGEATSVLDAEATRARVNSPMALGSIVMSGHNATVNPARLAWGLRDACLRLGVRLYEGTRATGFADTGAPGVTVRTESDAGEGAITAPRVALGTNAFPPLLRRLKHYLVPVYDYVLMTEPLTDAQWESVGWAGREGVSTMGNQFHYSRRTDDGRILFGGYDAIAQRTVDHRHDQRDESFALLAEQFRQLFPQLADVGFSHRWGGAIDTCSRFSAFFGTARNGQVAYAAGYTGLGVGATRFGAAVMLDLLDGRDTERTRTEMVSSMPLPFPPEPVRSVGISLTSRSLARADETGRRNLWLRTLDRLGMGFDS
jgi:glycine/D-amino acid oxidase-like deaminating enzyme